MFVIQKVRVDVGSPEGQGCRWSINQLRWRVPRSDSLFVGLNPKCPSDGLHIFGVPKRYKLLDSDSENARQEPSEVI
jgi:hypothetical protein